MAPVRTHAPPRAVYSMVGGFSWLAEDFDRPGHFSLPARQLRVGGRAYVGVLVEVVRIF